MSRRTGRSLTQAKLRSALSNGSTLIEGVDHRDTWVRRLRDLVTDHVSDRGGMDDVSASEMVLISDKLSMPSHWYGSSASLRPACSA